MEQRIVKFEKEEKTLERILEWLEFINKDGVDEKDNKEILGMV